MKHSSQYISQFYPYEIPLSNKRLLKPKKKTFSFDIVEFVHSKLFHYSNKVVKKPVSNTDICEAIFLLFLNSDFLLADKESFKKTKTLFTKQFMYFVKRKKPIEFNATQFAFKIPNPLKIRRTLPDLGELAFLSQLNDITQLIKQIYAPGGVIYIYGESYIFYKVVGISRKEASEYFKTIKEWINTLGWQNSLQLFDLSKLEKKVPKFKIEILKNKKIIRDGLKNKDLDTLDMISQVKDTLYTSINTRGYSLFRLMDIYNHELKKPSLSKIRNVLSKKSFNKSIPYTAYHQSINTSGLSSHLFPNSIKLSFTMGEKKLNLYPISRDARLYCYHGVPILKKNGKVIIRYEIDVLRNSKYIPYYIKNEKYPFFYQEY